MPYEPTPLRRIPGEVEAERASVAGSWLWVDVCKRRLLRLSREGVPACFGRSACFADGVRGCPRDPLSGCQRPRTYGGQRRRGECHSAAFAQVRGYVMGRGVAACKTVGFAYPSSNPGPATTCESGPLAANSRASGPGWSCPACRSASLHRLRCSGRGGLEEGDASEKRIVELLGVGPRELWCVGAQQDQAVQGDPERGGGEKGVLGS
jgi:hypothetical protein